MSHYECRRCGERLCAGDCKAKEAEKERKLQEKLINLELSKGDLFLLERAIHVIELTLPETSYARGIILKELLDDLKERIKT